MYEELSGWQESIREIRNFDQLPLEARRYINRLEELLSCPISFVAVGSRREQTIRVRPILP